MHFTNYLRYFEACEEEFYRSISFPFNGIHRKYGKKTIGWDFRVFRQRDGKLAAEGYMKCIAVNSEWKAVNLPAQLAKVVREKGR